MLKHRWEWASAESAERQLNCCPGGTVPEDSQIEFNSFSSLGLKPSGGSDGCIFWQKLGEWPTVGLWLYVFTSTYINKWGGWDMCGSKVGLSWPTVTKRWEPTPSPGLTTRVCPHLFSVVVTDYVVILWVRSLSLSDTLFFFFFLRCMCNSNLLCSQTISTVDKNMVKMCGCGQKGNLVFLVAEHVQDWFKAAGKLRANLSRNMKHAK